METIGDRFKKIRTTNNLTQNDFGAQLGMLKSGVSAVENNKVFVSLDVLRSLFLNFNISLNWFIMGKGEMFNELSQQNTQLENLIAQMIDKKFKEKGL